MVAQTQPRERIDVYLSEQYTEASRSALKQWLIDGQVLVNDFVVKPAYKVRPGDRITIMPQEVAPLALIAED